jgi:hypothetical protein
MLPVNLMHEIELGVWKTLLVHLLDILMRVGPETPLLLDFRFRNMASFGRGTIRPFDKHGMSNLPCLAARDYEDILQASLTQCAQPSPPDT